MPHIRPDVERAFYRSNGGKKQGVGLRARGPPTLESYGEARKGGRAKTSQGTGPKSKEPRSLLQRSRSESRASSLLQLHRPALSALLFIHLSR